MTQQPSLINLNDAFGKALIDKFFEPIPSGVSPDGQTYYVPSGLAMMAHEIFRSQQQLIMDKVWERLDVEELAKKIADLVVTELIRQPGAYYRNLHQEDLVNRVKEFVAQQLGQRVVDQMDLQIGPKAIEAGNDVSGS